MLYATLKNLRLLTNRSTLPRSVTKSTGISYFLKIRDFSENAFEQRFWT